MYTNYSKTPARKTKVDKYDFNPEDNLQRSKKMDRLVKEGNASRELIRIGQHKVD